jgi:HK97 family phage major capsid protein
LKKLLAKMALMEAEIKAIIENPDSKAEDITAKMADVDALKAKIEAQKVLDQMESDRIAAEAIANTPVNSPIYTKPAIMDKPWDNFGDQLKAVVQAGIPGGSADPRLFRNAADGANEAVPSEGGFLVDQGFTSELLKRTYETGVLASKCRKIPIGAGSNGIKINTVDETARANGSRWGGIRAYWADEADTVTASKPKFARIEMQLEKLMGICYATDELLEDSAALGAVVSQGFSEEFGFKIDDAIINGTGVGQNLGLMNSAALVSVAKETGQAADTIVFENILKMWTRMYSPSRANAAWYIGQNVEPQLFSMAMSVGTGGVPVYLPAGGISGQPYGTLFGRPVIVLEQCSALGDLGDILLANLNEYLLIDKGAMQGDQSIHVKFLYGENTFRFVHRLNGMPIWKAALTPYKSTADTLSPYVTLAERA